MHNFILKICEYILSLRIRRGSRDTLMLSIEKWHRLSISYCFVAPQRTLESALLQAAVRGGAGTDVKEKRTYVYIYVYIYIRTPRYPKGETISDGRQ